MRGWGPCLGSGVCCCLFMYILQRPREILRSTCLWGGSFCRAGYRSMAAHSLDALMILLFGVGSGGVVWRVWIMRIGLISQLMLRPRRMPYALPLVLHRCSMIKFF